MANVTKSKQFSFSMHNKVGLLSEITTTIAGANVNITALCAYKMRDNAHFMLITDNNAKTKRALVKIGIDPVVEDVIMIEIPNKVGEMKRAADKIAESNIDINYMYVTVGSGRSVMCVFKTEDNKRAMKVLKST